MRTLMLGIVMGIAGIMGMDGSARAQSAHPVQSAPPLVIVPNSGGPTTVVPIGPNVGVSIGPAGSVTPYTIITPTPAAPVPGPVIVVPGQ